MAIVTGGGRGIGRACAEALGADGLAVAAVARTESQVAETAAHIEADGGVATAITADLANPESANAVAAEAEQRLGGPSEILINAAGVTGPVGELAEIEADELEATFATNLTGAFAMCSAVLPTMRRRGKGRIVNVISGLAHRVQPGLGAYSASKAALLHLSRVLDVENRPHGVRVFAIEPGVVETEMNKSLMSLDNSGVEGSIRRMLEDLERDPGFVTAEESAELIRLAATGHADDLAGDACSIYDPGVRARLMNGANR